MVDYADDVWSAGVMSRPLAILVALALLVLGGATARMWETGPLEQAKAIASVPHCAAQGESAGRCDERGMLAMPSGVPSTLSRMHPSLIRNDAASGLDDPVPDPGPPRVA